MKEVQFRIYNRKSCRPTFTSLIGLKQSLIQLKLTFITYQRIDFAVIFKKV